MRVVPRVLLAFVLVAMAAGCGSPGGGSRPVPRSLAGTAAHGEIITVPSGTVDDWNIIVSPMRMGTEEPRSENDNRLLAFRVFATVNDDRSWQITAQYRFGYALNNADVYWVPGSVNYLVVPR